MEYWFKMELGQDFNKKCILNRLKYNFRLL